MSENRPATPAQRPPLVLPARENAELCCDMSGAPDTPEQRMLEYGRLFAHALTGRQRLPEGVEFRFAAKPGVSDWIADLAAREARCCAFFSHRVEFGAEAIVWRVQSQAGAAAQAILDDFHALPEHLDQGLSGMQARLAAKGVHVVATATGFDLSK